MPVWLTCKVPELYLIFDTVLSCDFALPELPLVTVENGWPRPASRPVPDLTSFRIKSGITAGDESGMTAGGDSGMTVRLGEGDPGRFDSQGFETAFEWRAPGDRVICRCERKDDEYLFVFLSSASFHISPGGRISCFLHQGASMQTLRHLLLNQIIPRYLATTGRLVLHASAVTLENGKSVAFLGNSGFGKSTLVSSFHRHGAQLINDDCILLECGENGVTAIGGLVGIRLFPDSVTAVFNESTGFTTYTPYTDKQQMFLKDQAREGQPEACTLDAMFLLSDPNDTPCESIRIEPVSGSEAMMAMIYSAFSLDPSDRKMIVGNFRNVGQAISEKLEVCSLQYPRVHDQLPQVRSAVVEYVSRSSPAF